MCTRVRTRVVIDLLHNNGDKSNGMTHDNHDHQNINHDDHDNRAQCGESDGDIRGAAAEDGVFEDDWLDLRSMHDSARFPTPQGCSITITHNHDDNDSSIKHNHSKQCNIHDNHHHCIHHSQCTITNSFKDFLLTLFRASALSGAIARIVVQSPRQLFFPICWTTAGRGVSA